MNKKEQKKLVNELAAKIEMEKRKQNVCVDVANKNRFQFNKKLLSEDEENQLDAFRKFLQENPDLTNEEVLEVLNSNKKKFAFLLDCEAKYMDFIESVKCSIVLLKHQIANNKKFEETMTK